jgi:hypothetical protein
MRLGRFVAPDQSSGCLDVPARAAANKKFKKASERFYTAFHLDPDHTSPLLVLAR